MTRDRLADADYFSRLLEEEAGYIAEDEQDIDDFLATKGMKADGIATSLVDNRFVCASIAYSRGDPIEDVRTWVVDAFESMRYLHQLYDAYPAAMRKRRGSYVKSLLRLANAILFKPGDTAVDRALHDVAFFQSDDPVLAGLSSWLRGAELDLSIADTQVAYPDSYNTLWQALKLGPDGSAPIKTYVENWYAWNDHPDRGRGARGIGAHEKMIRYQGYWCWEAAAVVVVTGANDLSFRDHEHYPKDLADWARGR